MNWLQITSGRGPAECQRFVAFLAEQIVADAGRRKLECRVIESQAGEKRDSLQSALLSLEGGDPALFARDWQGTSKWICQSPYRPNHRRKNWFAGVRLIAPPESPSWSEQDLRFDTMRSSGPGGQHVNKTESAVRITHVPSGIAVVAQQERSQHRNRALAMAQLAMIFDQFTQSSLDRKQQELWQNHWDLERGNEIRVYKGPKFKLIRAPE